MTQPSPQDFDLVAQREMRQLQDTIIALREEMESLRAGFDHDKQKQTADMDAEIRQLRETVSTLRDQLELTRMEADQRVHDAERAAREEMEEFKETIRQLRERLHGGGTSS